MKTLITREFKMTPQEKSLLESLGLEITSLPDEAAQVAEPEQFEAVICYNLFGANDINRFSQLKYIQLTSAGVEHMPVEQIRERGIWLKNARGVYSVPMAEFALSGVLQLYKRARQFWQNQQAHKWSRLRGIQELAGRQVCIVGVGSIGSELAKRFAAFDARVVGVDIVPVKSPYFAEVLPAAQLEQALAEADILALTVPLLASTQHMLNADRLALMKDGAVLINVARGAVVEQQALLEALQSGHLQGAVLDVFEQEPLPADSPLWDLPNVLVTPHNSFLAESNHQAMFKVVLRNLQEYLAQRQA